MPTYQKVKSVSKQVETKSERLSKLVRDTMKVCSDIVGGTLGPGGQPVLIERQEVNMPNMVTKDGVTVFRSLGFTDPVRHAIMESARDASVRTANEAGDGTTTATVLSEAIVRLSQEYTKKNPKVSPQKIVRRLERCYREDIEPALRDFSLKADLSTKKGKRTLTNVAKLSANGEQALADAVMECFDYVGDDGNVTIMEVNGPSCYEVEHIEGYPIGLGYEDSCGVFYPKFINDPDSQRCVLDKPIFVLFHGRINEIQSLVNLMEAVAERWQNEGGPHNVVIFAIGYSESVLGQLALNFVERQTVNVVPMLVPQSPIANGQLHFLEDVAAVTGAQIFDPLNKPLDRGDLSDLGPGTKAFEATRYRSTIFGYADELLLQDRVDKLEAQKGSAESILEQTMLNERIGKLTGGIAKLKVVGASSSEIREKRDRADDAVCAVRGAIKYGALPGGGWSLVYLNALLAAKKDPILDEVLRPALIVPVHKILDNCGYNADEIREILTPIFENVSAVLSDTKVGARAAIVYDAMEGKHVNAIEGGILDATPAVIEAIRNSISVASLLGTLGGCVVFHRDVELERREATDTNAFLRMAGENPADERA